MKKIISSILLILSVIIQSKHIGEVLTINLNPSKVKVLSDMNLNILHYYIFGILSLIILILILFPKTFKMGNIANLFLGSFIAIFSLKAQYPKLALEYMILGLIPLALIWLKHPMKNKNKIFQN